MYTAFAVTLLLNVRFLFGYNIDWSIGYNYYEDSSRSPYLLHFRANDDSHNEHLLLCWEEIGLIAPAYSGVCSTAGLNLTTNEIEYGSKDIFAAWNASDPHVIQIYDNGPTDFFLLAYTEGSGPRSGPGKILVGTKQNDGSLTYGPPATFNMNLNDQSRLLELQSNSYFIVCYSAGQFNAFDTACRVGQYHFDRSIMFGYYDFTMLSGHPTNDMGVTRINAVTFLSCFGAYVQRIGVCLVGTVNFESSVNSPINYGNEIVFNDAGTSSIQIIHASSNILIICYLHSNYGECKFAQIVQIADAYTVIFEENIFKFGMADLIESPSVFRVAAGSLNGDNPELLGVCYVDANAGQCEFGEIDLDALTITFGEAITNNFDDQGVGTITTSYLSRSQDGEVINKVIVCYVDFSGATPLFNKGVCKYGGVTDDDNDKKV